MNKKVSFEEIQKKFMNPAVNDGEDASAFVDESHFRFDSNDPAAIMIAGSSDSPLPPTPKACATGSTPGDGACASGAGGASSCDSGSTAGTGSS